LDPERTAELRSGFFVLNLLLPLLIVGLFTGVIQGLRYRKYAR
jgi:hypothetical protein